MLDCFAELRAQAYEKIVLIGSDSPDLALARLQQAFELLDGAQVAIGENSDGGFYLIGASAMLPQTISEDIVWSSESVMSRLLSNLQYDALGLSVALLPPWRDVDEESDLSELEHRLFNLGTHAPHTREFLTMHRGIDRSGA